MFGMAGSTQVPPARPVRPLRADARRNREALVAAARELFAVRGLDVPLEDIAKRAGVSIGTLYNHFPTRPELADAAFVEELAGGVRLAEEALAMPDPWAGFTHYLEGTCALQAGNRGYNEAACRGLPGTSASREVRTRMVALVAELMARAQAAGQLRADLTPTDLAFVIWGHSRTVEAVGDIAPNAWRRHLALLLDGFRAQAAHPLPEPPLTAGQVHRGHTD